MAALEGLTRGVHSMSLPRNQQTGATAETVATLAFQRWGWNVGRDRVDDGYDLIVTPDRDRYKGHRFLVQVKGTEIIEEPSSVRAPVERFRMRQYAADPDPVFVLRVLANGEIYWIHAQEWAERNAERIQGDGHVSILCDPKQDLRDRERFESCLLSVLGPLLADDRSLAIVQAESQFLNSLDPRFGVRLSVSETGKEHQIFARQENVSTKLKFKPSPSGSNFDTLREVFDYGLPGAIDVSEFRLEGSSLFEHLQSGPLTGNLTISPLDRSRGSVRLYAGREPSPKFASLAIEADLTRGAKGTAISNKQYTYPIDLDFRFQLEEGMPNVNLSFRFRQELIVGKALQDFESLDAFAPWAEQALMNDALTIQLRFLESTMSFTLDKEQMELIYDLLCWVRNLGRLYRVARALDSAFILPTEPTFTLANVSDLALAYSVLRGERPAIKLSAFEIAPAKECELPSPVFLRLTNDWEFGLFDMPLGHIPVVIDLSNYEVEAIPGSTKKRVFPSDDANAYISYWEPDSGLPKPSA